MGDGVYGLMHCAVQICHFTVDMNLFHLMRFGIFVVRKPLQPLCEAISEAV